jgi:hypothetical protein
MKVVGFTEEAFERYEQAFDCGAVDCDTQTVIDTILKEGDAAYYGDEGEMFYFDKYDLEAVYQ